MATVDVKLGGRAFPVQVQAGQEERARRVGKLVEERWREVAKAVPTAGDIHQLVLVAMMLGDGLFDAHEALDAAAHVPQPSATTAPEIDPAIAETVGRVADRISAIAARLEDA